MRARTDRPRRRQSHRAKASDGRGDGTCRSPRSRCFWADAWPAAVSAGGCRSVIAKPPAFAQRMQMDIEPLFTHVHTGINYRHRVFLERNLALHAGLAPHHLFRTNARTAGRISSPVQAKGPAVPAVRTPADGHPPECAPIIQQSVQIQHARGPPARPSVLFARGPCIRGFAAHPLNRLPAPTGVEPRVSTRPSDPRWGEETCGDVFALLLRRVRRSELFVEQRSEPSSQVLTRRTAPAAMASQPASCPPPVGAA